MADFDDDELFNDEEEDTPQAPKDEDDASDNEKEEIPEGVENEETFKIEIIVEDGSCVDGANSYVSWEDAVTYMQSHNRTDWLDASENEQKGSLVKATQYVDRLFRWKGRRKFEDQRLAFPRVMIRDLDGFIIKGIPWVLKEAIIEAAFYGYQDELFSVTNSESGAVKKKRVEGAVEIEYFASTSTDEEDDGPSKYKVLNNLLRGLYFPKNRKGCVNTQAIWVGV